MKKIKITETQKRMLESLDGIKLQEIGSDEVLGIAHDEDTGKYHMAIVSRDGFVRALEPHFSQFTFDDLSNAKDYFCANTDRIKQVLDEDIKQNYTISEDTNKFKAIASIDICKLGEDIKPSQSPAMKVSKQFKKLGKQTGIKTEVNLNEDVVEWSELVSHVVEFLKQIYTNPSQEGLSPFWKRNGVTWGDMMGLLTSLGIVTTSAAGGYRLTKFVPNPKKAVKVVAKLLQKLIQDKNKPVGNKYNKRVPIKYSGLNQPKNPMDTRYSKVVGEDDNLPAGASNDPRAPFNDGDEFTDPINPNLKFKLVYANDEIAIFKGVDNKLYVFYHYHIDKDDYADYASRQKTFIGKDEEGIPDFEYGEFEIEPYMIESYVNDNLDEIGIGTTYSDWEDGDKLVLITPEIKQELLSIWSDEKLYELLSGIGETTTASSSGAFVGKLNTNTNHKSNVSNEMLGMIDEDHDEKSIKTKIINQLKQIMIDKNITMEEWVAFEKGLKQIVDKIKQLGDEEWEQIIGQIVKSLQFAELGLTGNKIARVSFSNTINDLRGFISQLGLSLGEATTTVSAGGDSGTFAYDAPAGDGSDFWTAGNKINKKKSGVNEIKGRQNKNAFKDTQWPDGHFVEFDKCVKYNNNKEAQRGKCSTGAVDNVVKTKSSKHSVISDTKIYEEIAKKTGRTIEDVKKIIENQNKHK